MSQETFIIDGNNLIHRHPALRGLAHSDFHQARRHLVELLNAGAATEGSIIVVFDWKGGPPPVDLGSSHVKVRFAKGHESADTVIERLVKKARDPASMTVVTSDRLEQLAVQAAGGSVMSCDMYLDRMEDRGRLMRATTQRLRQKPRGNTLGDFFPET